MRQFGCGPNPLQAMLTQLQRPEEGRTHRQRMDGGTQIMQKARQSKFAGPSSPARFRSGFVHCDVKARLRERDGGGEPVGAAADYQGSMGHVANRLARAQFYGLT